MSKGKLNVTIALFAGMILLIGLWIGAMPYLWLFNNVKAIRVIVTENQQDIRENLM